MSDILYMHMCAYMFEQSTNHISLKKKPRYYAKSPIAQDMFQPIPGLIMIYIICVCVCVFVAYTLHR